MDSAPAEARVILALEVMENDKKLSSWDVVKLYNIPRSTLSHRRAGRRARRDTSLNSRKLIKLEEEAII